MQPLAKQVEIPSHTASQLAQTEVRSNIFTLRNILCIEPIFSEEIRYENPIFKFQEGAADMGVLAIVLAIILLSQRVAEEKALINHLLNLEVKDGPSTYVDFERLLNQFHHQGYLRKRRIGAAIEYRWGTRAFAETTLFKMTAFFSEILNVPFTETILHQAERSSGDR